MPMNTVKDRTLFVGLTLIGIASFVALGSWALAWVGPQNDSTGIAYDGFLEQNGAPVEGLKDFTVSVYGVPSGGPALYSETQTNVRVSSGRFHLVVGAGTATAGSFGALTAAGELFVGIAVADPAGIPVALNGRQRLSSVAYAQRGAPGQDFAVDGELGVAGRIRDRSGFVTPVGTVIAYAGTAVPPGWLACNGATVSRQGYAELFAALGVSWGPGDGSTTFHLPDLRGRFLRGQDEGVGRDPDRASRTASALGGNAGDAVGSVQDSMYTAHMHTIARVRGEVNTYPGNGLKVQLNPAHTTINGDVTGYEPRNWGSTADTGGSETRPVNAYVRYIIKY